MVEYRRPRKSSFQNDPSTARSYPAAPVLIGMERHLRAAQWSGLRRAGAKESTIFVITSGVKLSIGEKSPAPLLGAINCFCVKENSSFAALPRG